MLFKYLRLIVLPLVLAWPLGALAGPYSSLFVFGDSLSDTGNLVASGVPRPWPFAGPYDGGRFSNGALWIENVAANLGLAGQADPFTTGGNNYAFAGSASGAVPANGIPGLLVQSTVFWGSSHALADPKALYVVVSGGNDVRAARSAFTSSSAADQAGREAAALSAASNLQTVIGYLASRGARNFLLATAPDLGHTPEATLLGLSEASHDASQRFNALVPGVMSWGHSLGLRMNLFDLAALTDEIVSDPARFGIANTSAPCAGFLNPADGPGALGSAGCEHSLFSDVLHPTAFAHGVMARGALDVLGVPEPGTLSLFGLAGVALLSTRRRAS